MHSRNKCSFRTSLQHSWQYCYLLKGNFQVRSTVFFLSKICDCDQSYFAFLERYKLNEGERYVLKLLSLQESGIGFRNILFLWLIVLVLPFYPFYKYQFVVLHFSWDLIIIIIIIKIIKNYNLTGKIKCWHGVRWGPVFKNICVANVRFLKNQCSFCDENYLIVTECKSCWMYLLCRIALALNLYLFKIGLKTYFCQNGPSFLKYFYVTL